MKTPLTIEQINQLEQADFVNALGFLFEGTPGIAAQAWNTRPFTDAGHLYRVLCNTMQQLPRTEQVALIQAHPDLAGKAAVAGELTPESTREQASARLDQLSPEEFAEFTRLNQAYRQEFGFPFVICVRNHTKASILASFRERLQHTRDQEISTALDEIANIAGLRLHDAVREAGAASSA